jgi:hypothetical protein
MTVRKTASELQTRDRESAVRSMNNRAYFARERVYSRGTVLCDNRGDLSLANPCGCGRTARILPARGDLIVKVDRLLLKTMEIAEGAS